MPKIMAVFNDHKKKTLYKMIERKVNESTSYFN